MDPVFDSLPASLLDACRRHYGERLVALALFGSMGRGTPRPDSDVDMLVIADPLPDGRVARAAEFAAVERALDAWLKRRDGRLSRPRSRLCSRRRRSSRKARRSCST